MDPSEFKRKEKKKRANNVVFFGLMDSGQITVLMVHFKNFITVISSSK